MARYRVFLVKEVVVQLRATKRREQELLTRFFDDIAADPYRSGDFAEQDDIGREIQVALVGRHAIYFWSDHAVKEVKVVSMEIAGN